MFLATGGGAGHIPVTPGTFGSMLGVPVHWLFSSLSPPMQIAGLFLFGGIAVVVAGAAGRILEKTDASEIVIDEALGMAVTLAGSQGLSPGELVAGLFFFRLFDIWKPFPIRQLEARVRGGWGVVLDDVLAGVLANVSWRCALPLW